MTPLLPLEPIKHKPQLDYSINNVLTASNVSHLLAISKKQLENQENELLFINHLSARYDYAMIHIYFLIEFRNRTTKLLESIKNY